MLTNDNTESRRVIEHCYRFHKTTINPIVEWSDKDVWEFIHAHGIHYCCLYDEGFNRLGCVGCPMAGLKRRAEEFRRWPKYKAAYLHAFEKMIQERARHGKLDGNWQIGTDPNEIFHWWMQDGVLPGQYRFDLEEIYD